LDGVARNQTSSAFAQVNALPKQELDHVWLIAEAAPSIMEAFGSRPGFQDLVSLKILSRKILSLSGHTAHSCLVFRSVEFSKARRSSLGAWIRLGVQWVDHVRHSRRLVPGAGHRPSFVRCGLACRRANAQGREMALAGDTVALRLCLNRIASPRRDRYVTFNLPPIRTAADAVKASCHGCRGRRRAYALRNPTIGHVFTQPGPVAEPSMRT
jgi:hypothetical protein